MQKPSENDHIHNKIVAIYIEMLLLESESFL